MQTLLFYACCFTDKSGYYKSKLASFTEDPGYHRLSLCMSFACRTAAKLGPCCQPCFTVTGHRRHSCATSAFCAIEAVHRKVCWLTCCVRKDRRLNTDLRSALAPKLVPVAGPTVTHGPYCRLLTWTSITQTANVVPTSANRLPHISRTSIVDNVSEIRRESR